MELSEEDAGATELEADEVASVEVKDAQRPNETDQVVTVLHQIREHVDQLDAKEIDDELVNKIAADVETLRNLAAILKKLKIKALLARFDKMSDDFAPTITSLGAEAAIEVHRARISKTGDVAGDEEWLDMLVSRLKAIALLDGEIEELMSQITVAAADRDVETIERHTGVAHERVSAREKEVSAVFGQIGHGRREPREEVRGGTATILGSTYPLSDWSARGFCVGSCTIDGKVSDRLDIDFSVPLDDGSIEFSCRTRVLRVTQEKKEIAGLFVHVDFETQNAIAKYFVNLPTSGKTPPEDAGAWAVVERVKKASVRVVSSQPA